MGLYDPQPGDLILTSGRGTFGKLIRIGAFIRVHGDDKVFRWPSHVAIYVGDGKIVEALGRGVCESRLDSYSEPDRRHAHVWYGDERDRRQAVEFARAQVGARYSWLGILFIAINHLTGSKVSIGFTDMWFCSQLAAEAMHYGGIFTPRPSAHTAPCDIAKQFGCQL